MSPAAISQRVKSLKIATSKVVAMERAKDVVEGQFTAAQRLQKAQAVILDQVRWAEDQARQEGADRPALAEILVKLSAEIRAQVRLEHDISRTLIDLKVVRAFQKTVFEAIQQEAPETARRILEKLKAQRALRQSVELPGLDGRGGLDAL